MSYTSLLSHANFWSVQTALSASLTYGSLPKRSTGCTQVIAVPTTSANATTMSFGIHVHLTMGSAPILKRSPSGSAVLSGSFKGRLRRKGLTRFSIMVEIGDNSSLRRLAGLDSSSNCQMQHL